VSEGNDIKERKARVRTTVVEALNHLTIEQRALAAANSCTRLAATPEWINARSILGFAPMSGEINIWPLMLDAMVRGVQLALPRFDRATRTYAPCIVSDLKDLEPGYFGIREPGPHCVTLPTNLLDLILVPGVAFDAMGHRLGRGKGYYDRLLATWPGVTCGVAYDEQIVDEVPVEAHDVKLDCILTPTRIIRARGPE
jgi:5-formyltetrahydrofolate cyclo-ligase